MSATLTRRSGVRYQNWRDQAACRDADPELFFPKEGGSAQPAKAICAGCPVTAQCLRHALSFPEWHGVWAGLAERERQGMTSRDAGPGLCGKNLHLMDEANAYVNPVTGKRYCKACKADYRQQHETGVAA